MQTFLTQLRRSPVFSGLLAVLLLAVAMSSVGVCVGESVRRQLQAVSGGYRTIAVPREIRLGDTMDDPFVAFILPDAFQAALDSGYVLYADLRAPLAAPGLANRGNSGRPAGVCY